MISQADLIPKAAPAAADAAAPGPAPQAGFIKTLSANLLARNSNPVNPMTNTDMPSTIEEALQVIEDQKRIINTLNAKITGASTQRQLQA